MPDFSDYFHVPEFIHPEFEDFERQHPGLNCWGLEPSVWLKSVLGDDLYVLGWIIPFGKYKDLRLGDVPVRYIDQTLLKSDDSRWLRVIRRVLDLPFVNWHCLSTDTAADTGVLPEATLNEMLRSDYRDFLGRKGIDLVDPDKQFDGSLFAYFHCEPVKEPEFV